MFTGRYHSGQYQDNERKLLKVYIIWHLIWISESFTILFWKHKSKSQKPTFYEHDYNNVNFCEWWPNFSCCWAEQVALCIICSIKKPTVLWEILSAFWEYSRKIFLGKGELHNRKLQFFFDLAPFCICFRWK